MTAILRRVGKLEERYSVNASGKPRVVVRAIISFPWKGPLNWSASTCQRRLNPGGAVTEIVRLEGDADRISKEELEKFIAGFPIDPLPYAGPR
jgi:hypothetical protein